MEDSCSGSAELVSGVVGESGKIIVGWDGSSLPRMMTEEGVAERGASGSSSMSCNAFPGTMQGFGDDPSMERVRS